MGGACRTQERREMHTIPLLGNLKSRDDLEEPGVDGKTILEWILGKKFGKLWT
jgi:hypothetical protein